MEKIIEATCGVLRAGDLILMAQRPKGKVQAGYWEFPGGKIEAEESVKEALVRELHEELGISVAIADCKPLIYLEQRYPHAMVHLHVFEITKWSGAVKGIEGQQLFWHNIKEKCTLQPLLLATEKILALY